MENQNKSHEPMDIDLSSHSADMDISFNESITHKIVKQEKNVSHERPESPSPIKNTALSPVKIIPESNLKKFHIKKETWARKAYRVQTLKIFSIMLVLFVSIITYHVFNITCSDGINLESLNNVLSTQLYGQNEAINSMIAGLKVTDQRKILFFYGGTGVGKTFTASLILENVGYSSNVYHYTMPSFVNTFSTDFMIGLSMCKNSIMIVDDLDGNDMHITGLIKDVIAKSEGLQHDITVILIYNCDTDDIEFIKKCDDSFRTKLLESFSGIRASKTLVEFKSLTEEHLMKCIQNELKYRKVDKHELDKILNKFNVSVDGCKGVHTKMKLLETAKLL